MEKTKKISPRVFSTGICRLKFLSSFLSIFKNKIIIINNHEIIFLICFEIMKDYMRKKVKKIGRKVPE